MGIKWYHMTAFLSDLSKEEKNIIQQMRAMILRTDSNVKEETGAIMRSKNSFIYKEQGVFKYGLSKTKNHFSFHSMVMYAHDDVRHFIAKQAKHLKIQKGCISFKEAEDFPLPLFQAFLSFSASADFSEVINHYKNKK